MEALWAPAGGSARTTGRREEAHRIYGDRPDLLLCKSPEEALLGADALAV